MPRLLICKAISNYILDGIFRKDILLIKKETDKKETEKIYK